MRVKLKSGKVVKVVEESLEDETAYTDLPPGHTIHGISMLEKTMQVRETLAECLGHSAHIRVTLFGEGEAEKGKGNEPSPASVGGILADILEQAVMLRGQLERTGDYLQPTSPAPKLNKGMKL